MIQSKIWNYAKSNFNTLLLSTVSNEVNNALVESSDLLLQDVSGSIFNGAYNLLLDNLSMAIDEGEGLYDYKLSVKLQVGYEINFNGGMTSYNNAVNDIETIITERLQSSSYKTSNTNTVAIDNIELSSVNFEKLITENFRVAEINFILHGFITLT